MLLLTITVIVTIVITSIQCGSSPSVVVRPGSLAEANECDIQLWVRSGPLSSCLWKGGSIFGVRSLRLGDLSKQIEVDTRGEILDLKNT
jgi:hypothetical protein